MSFGCVAKGDTHLQPVGDVGIEGADMLHAPIEDVDGLLRRQGILRTLAGVARTAAQRSYQQTRVFFTLELHGGGVGRRAAAAGERCSVFHIENLPLELAGVAMLMPCCWGRLTALSVGCALPACRLGLNARFARDYVKRVSAVVMLRDIIRAWASR